MSAMTASASVVLIGAPVRGRAGVVLLVAVVVISLGTPWAGVADVRRALPAGSVADVMLSAVIGAAVVGVAAN